MTYVNNKGWTLESAPIIDRGKSAYTGDNITTGNLGEFASRFRAGALGPKVILVVEELDRLSRQPPDIMQSWLSPLLRSGLEVHVTQTNQVLNAYMLDHDMGGYMTWMMSAFGSNAESRKKAERIAASWWSKRNDARDGKAVQTGHRRVAWVDLGDDDEFIIRPEKLAVLQRMIARRIAGAGKDRIAQELNADGVDTWGEGKKKSEFWNPQYVGRILANRSLLGEWQPHVAARGKERKPVGDPILNFYPAAIDAATFALINDNKAKAERRTIGRERSISNVLGTKARCALCGAQMVGGGSSQIRENKDGSTRLHYYLYCKRGKIAKTCDNRVGFSYDRAERPLLDHILALAMDDQHFSAKGPETVEAERAVYQAREALMSAERRADRWEKAMNSDDPDEADAAMDPWRKAVAARKVAMASVKDAEEAFASIKGKVSPGEHIRRVQDVRDAMQADDPEERFAARLKVKTALADIVDRIGFFPQTRDVIAVMKEEVKSIWISHDGTVRTFDARLVQREPLRSNDPAIAAYLRRADAADSLQ